MTRNQEEQKNIRRKKKRGDVDGGRFFSVKTGRIEIITTQKNQRRKLFEVVGLSGIVKRDGKKRVEIEATFSRGGLVAEHENERVELSLGRRVSFRGGLSNISIIRYNKNINAKKINR